MINNAHESVILLFVKYPEPRAVKTRLASAIGPQEAAGLYGHFVQDTLLHLDSLGIPFRICFLPAGKKRDITAWLGDTYQYRPQRGRDLGQRMKHAFMEVFSEDYRGAILIGADLPDLPSSIFKEALDSLRSHEVVLGPSVDGGYYLIGFRDNTLVPAVFEGIPWGTEHVFRDTLSKLRDHKRGVYILPPWNDVDTIEDLKALIMRSRGREFSDSKTISFLSGMKALSIP